MGNGHGRCGRVCLCVGRECVEGMGRCVCIDGVGGDVLRYVGDRECRFSLSLKMNIFFLQK